MLYALGLMSQSEMDESLTKAMNGETVESEALSWSYEELCDRTFKLILPASYYQYDSASGSYHDLSGTEAGMDYLFNSEDVGVTLKVVGIARAEEGATSAFSTGGIGYTNALTTHAIEETEKMDIVVQQLANPDTDVFTGLPFATGEEAEPTAEEKISAITAYLSALTVEEKAQAYRDAMAQPSNAYVEEIVSQQTAEMTRESIEEMIVERYAQEMGVDGDTVRGYIADMDDETLFAQVEEAIATQVREQYAAGVEAQLAAMTSEQLSAALDAALAGAGDMALTEEQYIYLYDTYMPATVSEATYEENLDRLSYVELGSPSSISIYATSFAEKDEIADLITAYNESVDNEEDEITYTDYVALLMSSITDIINGISYLLIAFVSISLIVSSIMIGIITNISVLERTKEIGILRAVGASKRDVSRVFNAETFIVGLAAGLIGIAVSVLATIPINAILHHFTGIQELTAVLPVAGGAILVVISMLLTVVAGLIPARSAAKKDPVEALRTE